MALVGYGLLARMYLLRYTFFGSPLFSQAIPFRRLQVQYAERVGFRLMKRTQEEVIIQVRTYQLHKFVLPFLLAC